MIRSPQPHSRPAHPISAPSLFSLFATKRAKLTPLFSHSSALFKKECLLKPFAIKLFRTLSQNTRGCTLSSPSPFNLKLPALFTLLAASPERSLEGSGVDGSTRNLFSSLDALDAASSISPLFATLTKNTGGWGYPRRASHLFAFSTFNTKLPALFTLSVEGIGVEGSTACPVYPESRREPSRRVNRLSGLLCLPLSLISLPAFPFAASCTRPPSRTAAPSSSRMAPAQTANRNCSSRFPTRLPHPASPYCVSICHSAPSAHTDRLRPAEQPGTARVCGGRLPS